MKDGVTASSPRQKSLGFRDLIELMCPLHRRARAEPCLAHRASHVTQTMRPMPEKMSNAQTASSNWRSESRLKMFKPNHVPSRAAGRKTSTFQSICAAVEDDGRMW